MRLSPLSLVSLILSALFPVALPAQVFPPNSDLSRSISQLDSFTQVQAMAVDATGNVYLAGTTLDGLTGTATRLGPRGDADLFVIKTNSAGDQVIFATTIGGSFTDTLRAMKVDVNGNVYILGNTTSVNFPFTSTANPSNATGSFVLKLNAAGTAVSYARQLGARVSALGLDVDSSGAAYVSGAIASGDLTTTAGVIKTTAGAGVGPDEPFGFIAKLSVAGTNFDVATFFGVVNKAVESVSVNANGIVVLSNGVLSLLTTGLTQQTASVTVTLSPARIAFDGTGNIYLSGTARNPDFSPAGFALRKYAGTNLALQFDKSFALVSDQTPPRIGVAPNGRIFVFGQPISPNFETVNATQPCMANIAAPNGFAGLAVGTYGSLIGTIPPDQALLILDNSGTVLHSTFTTSQVSQVAIAPNNGRVYTSVVQSLITQPDLTYWRGIVRFNQDIVPAEKASPSCIVHGGTYQPVPLSPGTFMALYGTHLGPAQQSSVTQLTPQGTFPTSWAGASVTVEGRPAAVSFTWDKQINFLVPWATRIDGAAVPVCVTFDGATTCVQASTASVSPGGLPCDVNTGLTCAINYSGTTTSVNWPTAGGGFGPAKPGDTVALYMTGYGKVAGALVDGAVVTTGAQLILGEVLASNEPPPSGGCGIFACAAANAAGPQNVEVQYAGAAPGVVLGVNQINIKIPADTPDGLQVFTISFRPAGFSPSAPAITTAARLWIKK